MAAPQAEHPAGGLREQGFQAAEGGVRARRRLCLTPHREAGAEAASQLCEGLQEAAQQQQDLGPRAGVAGRQPVQQGRQAFASDAGQRLEDSVRVRVPVKGFPFFRVALTKLETFIENYHVISVANLTMLYIF